MRFERLARRFLGMMYLVSASFGLHNYDVLGTLETHPSRIALQGRKYVEPAMQGMRSRPHFYLSCAMRTGGSHKLISPSTHI